MDATGMSKKTELTQECGLDSERGFSQVIGYRDDPDLQTLIDTLQSQWRCCGVSHPDDWDENEYFASSSQVVRRAIS